MNRILFEKSEIVEGVATFGGERAEHVMKVLHGEVGQILKTGEIDGKIGTSEIIEILGGRRGKDSAAPVADAVRVGREMAVAISNEDANLTGDAESFPLRIKAKVSHDKESIAPWIDIILAPPRPRIMKRLLPQLATMGVGRIVLVGAQKVEKDFWGATLLKEENYRPLLIDGLMQGGTSILPKIECWKSFNRFLREGLVTFGTADRIVAHPYVASCAAGQQNELRDSVSSPSLRVAPQASPLLAIGPEGGWMDEEVAKLVENGFRGYSLGSRILRTDTATIALLAQLMQKYENHD